MNITDEMGDAMWDALERAGITATKDSAAVVGTVLAAVIPLVIEECAKALPKIVSLDGDPWDAGWNGALEESATAIRALKEIES